MMRTRKRVLDFTLLFLGYPLFVLGQHSSQGANIAARMKPVALLCESLDHPLGVDVERPKLSWKLEDSRRGAVQTAYRVLVADSTAMLAKNTGNVWDSGRVTTNKSIGVVYAGGKLEAEKRYYWRVQAWDKDGKPYPVSDTSWWEMGLVDSANWHAEWIGYEDAEHVAVRAAKAAWITNPAISGYKGNGNTRHDMRLAFDLAQPVESATLYATAEDTVSAWINGQQVLKASQQTAWGRLPWRTYTSTAITEKLHAGRNLLAIEALHYGQESRSITPINAVVYIRFADGSATVLKTGQGDWKAAFNASGEWYTPQYHDDSWAAPVAYPSVRDTFGGTEDLGIPLQAPPVSALRKTFAVSRPVSSARLYVTALGAYKMSVNGARVGDQILSPGWTDYRERVTYQVFDVTSSLHSGENALGAYLAPGWYATPLEWVGQGNNYGATQPALKAQLRIAYTDGSVEWVATDASWKADLSPILSAEIYNGETYDARRYQSGWDTAAFDDRAWHSVTIVQPSEPEIVWQSFQPIRAKQLITARTVTSPVHGTFIYDFGQNMAGVARIQVQGPEGADVRMRFGEQLNDDGTLFTANLRNAKATDHFILAGKGMEEYQPSFTFHGFRYLEITGVANALPVASVKAVVFHSDAPEAAQLKTGSAMLNQLWSNILWGQRSNFVGVPTDCPQRDERLGWSADAQVFWRTASYDMDLTAFSRKYAADLRGTQVGTAMYGIYAPGTAKANPGFGPGWSDAGVIVPWTSWIQSGDTTVLDQNWTAMTRYVDAILDANPDHIWKNKGGIGFGDWLAPEGRTSQELIATAYWAYDASLLKQMAHALGKSDEEQKYARLFEEIRDAFQAKFIHSGGIVGVESSHSSGNDHDAGVAETQTSYVLALHMNLLRDADRAVAAQRLVDRIAANGWKLGTGFLGTPYLLEVLTDTGHSDVAYRLLLNTVYPSWGYMVEHGATTMWERWNGDQMRGDPGMNSYNHYAYGAVAEWIYRYAAGIDTTVADPGFHVVDLHPNFNTRLGNLDFSYESPYGLVRSSWSVASGETTWKVTIPPNTSGRLPLLASEAQGYTVDGEALVKNSFQRVEGTGVGQMVFVLPAGSYSFTIRKSK
jgi:alpha-L-rhamnosidase